MWRTTEPLISDWYLVKVKSEKTILYWNHYNKFFSDFTGKTYKITQIDCWLDDSLLPIN